MEELTMKTRRDFDSRYNTFIAELKDVYNLNMEIRFDIKFF